MCVLMKGFYIQAILHVSHPCNQIDVQPDYARLILCDNSTGAACSSVAQVAEQVLSAMRRGKGVAV